MKILGLQKLSLLDYPGKVACIVFTGGCNFRCPFCHNGDLVTGQGTPEEIPEQDVLAFLKKRQGILEGVVVTGGEPLLQPDLGEFLQKVRALGYVVKLDTNGYLPDRIKKVVTEGLVDMVAMDVKNAPEKYAETAGVPNLDFSRIQESIDFLLGADVEVEFRTTVVDELHTPQDIGVAARLLRGAKRYYLQNFRAAETVIKPGLSPLSEEQLGACLTAAQDVVPEAKIRGK